MVQHNGNIINNNEGDVIINNINININAFGSSDPDFITVQDCMAAVNKGIHNAIPHLIERTHFNDNHPEEKNVYITNLRSNKAICVDEENRLIVKDQGEVIDQLVKDKDLILQLNLKDKYQRYATLRDNDPESDKKIKNNVKNVLYNNRPLKP